MTDKELLEKAIYWFKVIAEDMERITTGNLSHYAATTKGRAIRAYEFLEKHKEEPVSEDICNQCEAHNDKDKCDELVFGHKCPIVTTSEDLEEASGEYTSKVLERTNVLIGNQPVGEEIDAAFKAGVQWQKEHLWKPADGDDLPEYEREVVVFTQIFPDDAEMMRVAIGHRPNPEGWDGKSLSTGKVEHYTPKTYDKGGWNIPNVKYWLDCLMPKEIEL